MNSVVDSNFKVEWWVALILSLPIAVLANVIYARLVRYRERERGFLTQKREQETIRDEYLRIKSYRDSMWGSMQLQQVFSSALLRIFRGIAIALVAGTFFSLTAFLPFLSSTPVVRVTTFLLVAIIFCFLVAGVMIVLRECRAGLRVANRVQHFDAYSAWVKKTLGELP